ncbi:MAG: hypothetical protein KUG79_04000 [Pseudomonadales bacterium]|nr:hypothetical protein [Pseudomonadales bacterium]
MTHLTELQYSMYADEALPPAEVKHVKAHISACKDCQLRFTAYSDEKRLIRNALSVEQLVAIPGVLPKFTKPVSLQTFALANVITGLVIWLAQFLWKTLFGEFVVNLFSWFAFPLPDVYGLLADTAFYLSQKGVTMIVTYLDFVAASLSILVLMWLAYSFRKARRTGNMTVNIVVNTGLLAVLATNVLIPEQAYALEHRSNKGLVTVEASETVDDTLVITAETIVIDGQVNGDLIAFARRVIVNGAIDGNLISFGKAVSLQGKVNGSVLSGANTLELNGAVVMNDFWGAAHLVTINGQSRIGRNAIVASELAVIAGKVGRDLYGFAESIELSGAVGEDVEAFVDGISLLGAAIVAGDLRIRTHDENKLQQAASATIGGEVEYVSRHAEFSDSNRYLSGKYYLWQVLRLVAALLAGILLLWFIPKLRNLTLGSGSAGVMTAGIGLVTLISMPIILLLLTVTVVGLPFAAIGLFFWLMLIYFAKIVLAAIIGRMVLSNTTIDESLPLTLLVGLVVVILAINLPLVGGIFSFILTVLGVGLMAQMVWAYTQTLNSD